MMKKTSIQSNVSAAGKLFLAALAVCVAALLSLFAFLPKTGGMSVLKAQAYNSPKLAVHRLDAQITVNENRKIHFKEKITVEFLQDGLTMFYRSLPLEGDMYENIQASCQQENTDFSYYVQEEEEYGEFLEICCVGGAEKGNIWTYELSYTMTIGVDDVENGMILDVVGAGWPIELNDVTITVDFPEAVQSHRVYSGGYGATGSGNVSEKWSADKKQVILHADKLELVYNDTYYERMAEAITLQFVLPQGALQDFVSSQFTSTTWLYVLVGVLAVVVCFVIRTLMKGGEILTPIVNLKAPKEMDPMQMGLHIDGIVDGEDVTSMIYYFASKGYLNIDMQDESNPVLYRKGYLPENAPAYQKTLFDGLFKRRDYVSLSQLKNEFYQHSDEAMLQVQAKKKKHYTGKSVFGFLLGGIIAAVLLFLIPLLTSTFRVGGGYGYMYGGIMFIPVGIVMLGEFLLHTHRFKWRKGIQTTVKIVLIVITVIVIVIYGETIATHVLTKAEKYVIAFFALVCPFITGGTLSYTKEYNELLGDILGFKDFIVVTEEDKIKFMLEENPELYYDVLPYAQVLGVTDEWQEKFAGILLQPPAWYVGSDTDVYDYLIMRRCMRTMSYSMLSRPQESGGVGRSGGGGHFGGFSGGGHGGGGGGAR